MLQRAITMTLALLILCAGCQQEGPQKAPKKVETPDGSYEKSRPPALDEQPVDVQVTKPIRKDLTYTITLPANIAPLYQTTLYAKVSGYLKWIGPDKGDTVKKNDVVAIIDAPEVAE